MVEELKEFLEGVFLTLRSIMVREADKTVTEKRYDELVSLYRGPRIYVKKACIFAERGGEMMRRGVVGLGRVTAFYIGITLVRP